MVALAALRPRDCDPVRAHRAAASLHPLDRAFGWVALLSNRGLINTWLQSVGFISEPLALVRNEFGVIVGMTHFLIPFAVFPLASALRVLSAEFRNERMMRAEEKAARLPAIMTVPLILFILPTLFVVILGPAACSISDNFLNG